METETDSVTSLSTEKDPDWTGTYTWRVKNWTQLTIEKIYSPEFEIGGYLWRLLVFPKGDKANNSADNVSVYLDFPEVVYTPPKMCPTAKFEFVTTKGNDSGDSRKRNATHTFTIGAKDWGFYQFLLLHEAQNAETGYLVNDTLTLRVKIFIQGKDNLGMRSRLETGFVGIRSPEETSLLTSFLQCMFNLKVLRKAVFQMPTLPSDDPKTSLPLVLQHLFYELKCQNISAKTKNLIKALNCELSDIRLQHGMRKIQHILFDKLSRDFRANSVMDCISALFTGEHSTFTESLEMQDAPTSKQSFTEISLDVVDCKDVHVSLEKLCRVQKLREGKPRRRITRGLDELKHYMRFDSFPVILLLHLKRSHYNPERNAFIKINTPYEFYDELDLDCNDRTLMSKNDDQTIENKYWLHSVLVHTNGPGGGRYCAFIRRDRIWFKFDGEVVKKVSAEEAINAQFGDQNGTSNANFSTAFESVDRSTAVLLTYVRKSEWNAVMCEARSNCLPQQISIRFDVERMFKEKRHKDKKEAHAYVIINLATEFHFAEQIGNSHYVDLVNFNEVKYYRIHKKTSYEGFKELVNKDFGIPKQLQRFWLWRKRTNNTMRISEHLIEEARQLKTVLDLKAFKKTDPTSSQEKTALMTINLFLETPEGHSLGKNGILHAIQENELLIFVKYYDPASMALSYLGHLFVQKTSPFRLILERAKKMAGLAQEDKVIGFAEVRQLPPIICLGCLPESTPKKNKMTNGDIIVIQKPVNRYDFAFPFVNDFLEHVQNG